MKILFNISIHRRRIRFFIFSNEWHFGTFERNSLEYLFGIQFFKFFLSELTDCVHVYAQLRLILRRLKIIINLNRYGFKERSLFKRTMQFLCPIFTNTVRLIKRFQEICTRKRTYWIGSWFKKIPTARSSKNSTAQLWKTP